MIEGRHFRSAEARRRTFGEAIDRYTLEELPKERGGGMATAALGASGLALACIGPIGADVVLARRKFEPD
jgi:hypothetical protein